VSSTSYYGREAAPDFPTNLEWVNSKQAVSLINLRGKIVILDFWTYC